jgi:hypothetical protein
MLCPAIQIFFPWFHRNTKVRWSCNFRTSTLCNCLHFIPSKCKTPVSSPLKTSRSWYTHTHTHTNTHTHTHTHPHTHTHTQTHTPTHTHTHTHTYIYSKRNTAVHSSKVNISVLRSYLCLSLSQHPTVPCGRTKLKFNKTICNNNIKTIIFTPILAGNLGLKVWYKGVTSWSD